MSTRRKDWYRRIRMLQRWWIVNGCRGVRGAYAEAVCAVKRDIAKAIMTRGVR